VEDHPVPAGVGLGALPQRLLKAPRTRTASLFRSEISVKGNVGVLVDALARVLPPALDRVAGKVARRQLRKSMVAPTSSAFVVIAFFGGRFDKKKRSNRTSPPPTRVGLHPERYPPAAPLVARPHAKPELGHGDDDYRERRSHASGYRGCVHEVHTGPRAWCTNLGSPRG
jgi:hypothetical protein